MRLIPYTVALAVLTIPAAVYAQRITVAGWVDRVDTVNSTITVRTLGNPRTIAVAPEAIIRINGVASRLDRLPANAQISIVAEKGPNDVLRATQIIVQTATAQPSAAVPSGSLIAGTLVGMNVPENTITVRTRSGDHVIPLASAPILVNGRNGSKRDLRVGQPVRVQRSLPTEGSTDYVTQVIRILPAGVGAQGTAARTQRAVRSQTRGYRSTYQPRKSGKRVTSRTSRSRTRSRVRSRSTSRTGY